MGLLDFFKPRSAPMPPPTNNPKTAGMVTADPTLKYRDLSEYHSRYLERYAIDASRCNRFFEQIDNVFAASGVADALHDKYPARMNVVKSTNDSFDVKIGWELPRGGILVLEVVTTGYKIFEPLPDGFNDHTGWPTYSKFSYDYEIALSREGEAMRKKFSVGTYDNIENPLLPSWAVKALEEVLRK